MRVVGCDNLGWAWEMWEMWEKGRDAGALRTSLFLLRTCEFVGHLRWVPEAAVEEGCVRLRTLSIPRHKLKARLNRGEHRQQLRAEDGALYRVANTTTAIRIYAEVARAVRYCTIAAPRRQTLSTIASIINISRFHASTVFLHPMPPRKEMGIYTGCPRTPSLRFYATETPDTENAPHQIKTPVWPWNTHKKRANRHRCRPDR